MKLPTLRRWRRVSRGQALVEFAIILPILALLMVLSLDVGRVFFGWVGLQNVSRIGANFAANHPGAWDPNIPPSVINDQLLDLYAEQLAREAAGLGCTPLPQTSPEANIPVPDFDDLNGNTRYDVGERVSVTLGCTFDLLTPLANNATGGGIHLTAISVFPVKGGAIGINIPVSSSSASPTPSPSASSSASVDPSASGSASASSSAEASPCPLPIAGFTATPTTGKRSLTVSFNNTSQTFGCAVTGWVWDFGDGSPISTVKDPVHIYTRNGTYSVTLTVISPGGTQSTFQPGYIQVCGNC